MDPKHTHIPSHILYVDDVKAYLLTLLFLLVFFAIYAQISSQIINHYKSTIFVGSISHCRLSSIANSIGFSIGRLPFIYLGMPIFKGKPKAFHLQSVVDKIKLKLA
jgi:hypothetical protein